MHGWDFKMIGNGCEGGSVDSSLLDGSEDNKWLNLPTSSSGGSNEWVLIFCCTDGSWKRS